MYLTQVSLDELRAIISEEVKKAVAEAGANAKSGTHPDFDELITEEEAVTMIDRKSVV